jgi:CelD/BcsL family acetyltransferase involved in cellulose biosynthesis
VTIAAATSVRVFRDRASLDALVPAWEELSAAALEPNPFYEPWMLLPALELLAGDAGVLVVAVWVEGQLCALVPLARARLKGLPVGTLTTWRHAHCLLCTPLVRAGRSASAALGALLDWVRDEGGVAAIEWRYLPAGGAVQAALSDALEARGMTSLPSGAYTRAVLRRGPDAQSYLESAMSAQARRTNGKKERQLQARGTLEYSALGSDADARAWIDGFLALESSGWKGQAGTALGCTEHNRRFAVEVLVEAHRRGRLLASGIDFDGKPIGRLMCFLCGTGSIAWKTAYDEAFRTYGPGVLTEVHAIHRFHALPPGVQWMDSFTAPGNALIDRLWKDRLLIQDVLVATRPAGELALALLPALRWMKRALARLRARVAARGRALPARGPRPAASAP